MSSSTETELAVQKGIQFLDEIYPDWIDSFNENTCEDIRIESSNLHILAIVSGVDYNLSFRCKSENEEGMQFLISHGFHLDIDTEEPLYTQIKSYADLNEEWITQVMIRLAQVRPFGSESDSADEPKLELQDQPSDQERLDTVVGVQTELF